LSLKVAAGYFSNLITFPFLRVSLTFGISTISSSNLGVDFPKIISFSSLETGGK